MKIVIIDPTKNKNLKFTIPNSMLMNRFSFYIIQKALNKEDKLTLSSKQIIDLMKELKNSVQYFGHYELVDIESHDGEKIKITL